MCDYRPVDYKALCIESLPVTKRLTEEKNIDHGLVPVPVLTQ